MAITESRIRRIIREEAIRVMSEQGTAQQAGAAVDAAASTAKAHLTAQATPQQIDQAAATITDALLRMPVLAVLRITPNGRETLLQAVKTVLTGRQDVAQFLFSGGVPGRLIVTINEMVTTGQAQGIITRLMQQNKGYAEIIGALIDAAATRMRQA